MSEQGSGGRALRVTVDGLFRGHELRGEGELVLEGHTIILLVERAHTMLPLAQVEGVLHEAGTLELHMEGGDMVRVSGGALAALAAELERRALIIPELTRSLRVLGSPGALPAAEHDRFFAPLLDARRAAAGAALPEAALAALGARALRAALTECLRGLAAERYPTVPPERRALEAELLECAAEVLASLDALERAEESLARAGHRERLGRWRGWAAALQGVFTSADECWPALGAVLVDERREEDSRRWRGASWLRGGRESERRAR